MADAPAEATGERRGLAEQRAERRGRRDALRAAGIDRFPLLRREGGA